MENVLRLCRVIPEWALAGLFLGASVLTAFFGLLRARRSVGSWAGASAFVGTASMLVWPRSRAVEPGLAGGLLCLCGAALVWHFARFRESVVDTAGPPRRHGIDQAVLGLTVTAVLAFGLFELGTYVPVLLAWEPSVVQGFEDAWRSGTTSLGFLARTLRWEDGLVSAGYTSFFYGPPTYALLTNVGWTPAMLRLSSVLATVAALVVAFVSTRRLMGQRAASWAVVLLAVSPTVLYYARYGSCPAGTLLSLWIVLAIGGPALDGTEIGWGRALALGAALFLATLQYAPARIVVVLFLGFLALALLGRSDRGHRQWLALVILILSAGLVFGAERSVGHQGALLRARGEQIGEFMTHPGYIREYLGPTVQPGDLGMGERLEIVRAVVSRTVPELLELMTPQTSRPSAEQLLHDDPPRLALYQGPLALFVCWGAVESFRRRRRLLPWFFAAWVAAVSASLLLTNRVDAHRLSILVIPFTVWAAWGLRSFEELWAGIGVPRALRASFFCLLAALGGVRAFQMLSLGDTGLPPVAAALRPVIAAEKSWIVMAVEGDNHSVGWAHLLTLNRVPDPSRPAVILLDSVRLGLFGANGPEEGALDAIASVAERSLVVLGPMGGADVLRGALLKRGLRVRNAGTPEVPLQLVSAGEPARWIPDRPKE